MDIMNLIMSEMNFPESSSEFIWTSERIPDVQFCVVQHDKTCVGYARFPFPLFKNPGCGMLEQIPDLCYIHIGKGLVVGFNIEGSLDNYQTLIYQTEEGTKQVIRAAELEEQYVAADDEEKQFLVQKIVCYNGARKGD